MSFHHSFKANHIFSQAEDLGATTSNGFVPTEHCLNATAYLSIADHFHLFMAKLYLSSDGQIRALH